jgi:hypothetical protein
MQGSRVNHQFRHAGVGLVRRRILIGEGIGKIGIEEDVNALPLQEKSALSQPPEAEATVPYVGRLNISQQCFV